MDPPPSPHNTDEILKAQAQIWKWALSHITSHCIKCAIDLHIPDLIQYNRSQPSASVPELISALHIPPSKSDAFRCMLRILSTPSVGFLSLQPREDKKEEMYSLTPASRVLLQGQAPPLLLNLHPVMKDHFSALGTWLLERGRGECAPTTFEIANGMPFWDYLAAPGPMGRELKGLFYDCMASDSKLVADALVSEELTSLFEGVSSFVDVAGGTGTVAAAVARAFPGMKCTVLDLPHVITGSRKDQHPDNLEFVGGDMFRNIPPADVVLLKWILHNWDDKPCVEILKCCKEAVSSSGDIKGKQQGKVMIIDMVVKDDDQQKVGEVDEVQLYFNLLMMTLYNGKERNEREWIKLFEEAGFSNYKIVRSLGPKSIIEAYP